MKFVIKKEELSVLNGIETPEFPKYTSQLINWANQNAQGTRPRVVGQLSDLFPEYEQECDAVSIDGWREWYLKHYPDAIKTATDKIFSQVENLKVAIQLIDKAMVEKWVNDLVISKTYKPLYVFVHHIVELVVGLENPGENGMHLANQEHQAKGQQG